MSAISIHYSRGRSLGCNQPGFDLSEKCRGWLHCRVMAPDYSHIVFPELNCDLYRSRQERVAETLDAIQSAIAREKRDLQREANGQSPVEGVGTQIARQLQ